jgi:hypothetical protein
MNKHVEEYQCPGCVSGPPDCYAPNGIDVSCTKHCPGTYSPGIGHILLGMPKGFNRIGHLDFRRDMGFSMYNTYEDFIKDYVNIKTKYCVPVWRYLSSMERHTFLRLFNPRTNTPEIVIILEDCVAEFKCIEITESDIGFMD